MRGGELIVDLKNVNFINNVGQVVEGIYELLESTRKPVRLCNVKLDGNEKRDIVLTDIGIVGSDYSATITIGQTSTVVTITNTDTVTFGISG